MKNIIFLIFVFVSASFSQIKNFSESDSVITVRNGEVFEISLRANHSTGFRWVLGMSSVSQEILVVDCNYIMDDAPEGMTGVGGTETWRFKARKSGVTELNFYYMRPWENDFSDSRVFKVTVD